MDGRVVRIGTRASALARAQTRAVMEALGRAWPEVRCELVPITTGGDRSQSTNRPGPDWGSGVFVKELEAALLRGEIDLAVHSLKDVPPLGDPRLVLAAFPTREDPLDVLVTPPAVLVSAPASAAPLGAPASPDRPVLPAAATPDTRPPAAPDRQPSAPAWHPPRGPLLPERWPPDPSGAQATPPSAPLAAAAATAASSPAAVAASDCTAPEHTSLDTLDAPAGQPLDILALDVLARGARVGTSSARRAAFLGALRPDLVWLPIRGNVETRLRKLAAGQYDAVVLARAGLLRLGLDVPYLVLGPALLPPAPGQGALAVQTRAADAELRALVAPLDDPATRAAVRAERHLMALLEGGCRLPVGALATAAPDGTLTLIGGFAGEDGRAHVDRARGAMAAPEALAETLASRLRQRAARVLPV